MEEREDPKARVNPAARHDRPSEALEEEPPRTPERQVQPKQGEKLNPLDPGGIGG